MDCRSRSARFRLADDGGFEFVDQGEAALDLGDDAGLLGERWEGNGNAWSFDLFDVGLTDLLPDDRGDPAIGPSRTLR